MSQRHPASHRTRGDVLPWSLPSVLNLVVILVAMPAVVWEMLRHLLFAHCNLGRLVFSSRLLPRWAAPGGVRAERVGKNT